MTKLSFKTIAAVAMIAACAQFLTLKGASQSARFTADLDPDAVADDSVSNAGPATDDELLKRLAAMRERFGEFGGDDQKQALLAVAMRQAAIDAPLLPGGVAPPGVPQWRSLGPATIKNTSWSGRTRRVLQDPRDADRVFVLTAGGGLWKTTTFGHTNPAWQPLTDALMSTSGGNVAFGRSPDTLYLGVGDPFFAAPTLTGFMVKSTDGGASWSAFANLAGANSVRDVAVDTSEAADIVLAATDAGVYRSGDAGTSYSLVLSTPTPACHTYAFHDGGFWSFARTSAGWLVSTCDGRIFRSTDRGATWAQAAALPGAGRSTLAARSPGDALVFAFAGTLDGFSQDDLFRSIDGGMSWTALGVTGKTPTNPTPYQPTMNLMADQAFYNQLLLVDPDEPNTIYLGGQLASAKSTDAGQTWTLLAPIHADYHTATTLTLNGQRALVFGTDGGIFVSSDGGGSFDSSKNDGIVATLTQTVISSAKTPQSLITGTQDDGTQARLGSSSFFNVVTGGDGEGVGWSQANNAVTLATVEEGWVLRSDGLLPNTIGTWRWASPPHLRGDTQLFTTPIATPSAATDPSGLIFLTASARRLWVTLDGAASWFVLARVGSRLPSDFRIADFWHGIGLEASDPQFNRVAVAGENDKIAITIDGGFTWTVRDLAAAVPGMSRFISSPAWTANGVLYVAGGDFVVGKIRVVKSFDNGSTWHRADVGLPDASVFHIVVDPRDQTGQSLFAATSFGVYVTSDGGGSWSRFGAGLPAVEVDGLWITADGSLLRAATFGRGIWEITR